MTARMSGSSSAINNAVQKTNFGSKSVSEASTTVKLMIPWDREGPLTLCLSQVRRRPCKHSMPMVSGLHKTAPTKKGKRFSTSLLLMRVIP